MASISETRSIVVVVATAVVVVAGSVVVVVATVVAVAGSEEGTVAGVAVVLHPATTSNRTVNRKSFPHMATPYGMGRSVHRGPEGSFSRADIVLYRQQTDRTSVDRRKDVSHVPCP